MYVRIGDREYNFNDVVYPDIEAATLAWYSLSVVARGQEPLLPMNMYLRAKSVPHILGGAEIAEAEVGKIKLTIKPFDADYMQMEVNARREDKPDSGLAVIHLNSGAPYISMKMKTVLVMGVYAYEYFAPHLMLSIHGTKIAGRVMDPSGINIAYALYRLQKLHPDVAKIATDALGAQIAATPSTLMQPSWLTDQYNMHMEDLRASYYAVGVASLIGALREEKKKGSDVVAVLVIAAEDDRFYPRAKARVDELVDMFKEEGGEVYKLYPQYSPFRLQRKRRR